MRSTTILDRRLAAVLVLTIVCGESGGQTVPARSKPSEPAPPVAGALSADVLKKVKRATVQVRVQLPNKRTGQGSGFFGVEPGLVLTNAHVLDMFRPDSRRPSKVEVVIQSGQRDERTLPAEVLGADTGSDLAVLRVKGSNLPDPLTVGPAEELLETQSVYVFGFPFSDVIGKAITVNTSSVSSLRRNNLGVLQRVQVNGGMNPGNSGGPVVDTSGNVIGVAVSAVSQTQINFAVPGELVHSLLAGKVNTLTFGQPYKDGATVKSLFEVRTLDPLNKIRKVSVTCWTGPSAKNRADAPAQPAADSPKRQTVDLTIEKGYAKADVLLPKLDEGDVYWIVPVVDGSTLASQKWLPVLWTVRPPVERTPAVLALKYEAKAKSDLEMTSIMTLAFRDELGGEHSLVSNMKLNLTEEVVQVNSDGNAELHLRYSKISMGLKLDGKVLPKDEQLQKILPNLFRVGADLRMDPKGTILDNRLDLTNVPLSVRPRIGSIAERIKQSVEAAEVILPGKLTDTNTPWTGQRDLPIDTPGDDETGVIDVKYTYLGQRTRNKIREALIDLKGDVKGRQGKGQNIGGHVQGLAFLDLDAGRVFQVNVTTYLDMDLIVNGRPAKANGKLEVKLARRPAGEPAAATK